MIAPKITPGEWKAGAKGRFGTSHPACIYQGLTGEADEKSIGRAYGVYENMRLEAIEADPADLKHCAEGLANARMMAAAPKLAEALNVALNHLVGFVVVARIQAALTDPQTFEKSAWLQVERDTKQVVHQIREALLAAG